MATVKLFGNLRRFINASKLQIPGESAREVIEALCNQNHQICEALLEGGEIRPHFKITLNGHDILLSNGLDTGIVENDTLAIFSPIAGG